MGEHSDETKEKSPEYLKKAQWFGLAAVGLLCLTLILSVFIGGGKGTSRKEPLPIDRTEKGGNQSQHNLQERMRQERLKRQRELQERKDNIQGLTDRKETEQREQEKEPETPPSIEEEFKLQEKRRALMARRSGFGLRPQRISNTAFREPGHSQKKEAALKKRKVITERQRIEQKLRRLQGGGAAQDLKSESSGISNFSFGQEQPKGQGAKAPRAPRERVTVGQPASEGGPKPGQRLIPTGTVISGVLDQKLMSDYTGPFRGLTTNDVYDVTGNYVVIPKGSRITGRCLRITNVNEPIQARMGLTVKWLVLPDGKRISFKKRGTALDQEGVPAIKDKVNYHLIAQFLGVAAYAVLSSETSRSGSGSDRDQTFEGELGASAREQFAPLAAKYLNLVPTVTLRIGTPLKIFLEDDVYAYPWASLGEKLYQSSF